MCLSINSCIEKKRSEIELISCKRKYNSLAKKKKLNYMFQSRILFVISSIRVFGNPYIKVFTRLECKNYDTEKSIKMHFASQDGHNSTFLKNLKIPLICFTV